MPTARRAEPALPHDLDRLAARIWRCTRCDLHASRTHAVPGEGRTRAPLFLVGEAPGRDEDSQGRPFRGAAGRILDEALSRAGIRRDEVFITNAVKCRPRENRKPLAPEVAACRPFLLAQLATVRPRVVVALGETAIRDLLGPHSSLRRTRGRWTRIEDVPVLATYHPAAVLYNRRLFRRLVSDLRRARAEAESA